MNITAIAIVSIVFGTAYAIFNKILNHRRDSRNFKQGDHSMTLEIERLKERVATLERIVTDDKYQLQKQFDSLK